MQSMTGFGQASAESTARRIQVTLRAVNHRFLDLVMRLPEECRGDEAALQRLLGRRLARGRVELAVDLSPISGDAVRVELRAGVVASLAAAARDLSQQGVAAGDVRVADLLALPGVVEISSSTTPWSAQDGEGLHEAVDLALDQLVAARTEEGARLETVVLEKLGALESLVADLEALRPGAQRALLEGLRARLAELVDSDRLDRERLEQEALLLVERSNVAEELERLVVHLGHARTVLGSAGPVGKRLDFLVQEVFRELNTLSAKCRSTEMTRLCVDSKVLCEELREQLRNVE